jgi:serine/threonine protein kinase/formylglycine-generating enzyme required for sulfatase activity
MPSDFGQSEDLIRRLPLPLAKLYRHATNAKSPLDQHQAAYFMWEAAVKLLAVGAVAIYGERPEHDEKVCEQLKSLTRPTLGEWRKIVRMLMPILAENDEGYRRLKSLMERSRDNLPRAAGLDAVLREVVEKKTGARSTVKLSELFDRLVTYRNMEVGHGAIGLRLSAFYGRMGRSLLAAIPEILSALDVLVGRRLIYIADIARQPNGHWLVERFELIGETPRRLDPLDLPQSSPYDALVPERVYLESGGNEPNEPRNFVSLHPLASCDRHAKELLYLNSYRDRKHCDYLCYSSGEVQKVDELCGQFGPLLSRVFGDSGDSKSSGDAAGPKTEAYEHAHDKDLGLRTIGEFELLSKLGQGGMGVVYRAWQPSVGRQVALKCLFRAGDAKAAERFSREYRALGRVDHPHLVKVYTSGAEGDQWFYAMELIEGATLAAVCERLQSKMQSAAEIAPDTWKHAVTTTCEEARRAEEPLSTPVEAAVEEIIAPPEPAHVPPLKVDSYVRHVVELIRQIATAAHKLHEAGVVHRDIKPGNIMLTADGAHAVLMDLGLAQLMDREKLTHTRQFVGTLRYASPEQVLAVDRLDGRSDIYSIGATLWELLTLRPMFSASDDTPTPELMKRIQFEDAELASKYYLGIPRDLEAIVAKCLEKNPQARYATAGALADDLARWLSDKPVQAQPTNWRYRAGKFLRRNRRRLAVGSAAIAVQVALVIGLYHWLHSPQTADGGVAALSASGRGTTSHILSDGDTSSSPGAGGIHEPLRRALLVGCTKYPNAPQFSLQGPANDVPMLRDTLITRFGIAPDDIVELLDSNGDEHRPTRANIARQIAEFGRSANANEQVVIYLGGNGSMAAPAQTLTEQGTEPNKAEPAPLTAVPEPYFWPEDVGQPQRASGTPNGAIAGHEFAQWIQPLLDKGANVWLVYDCCHGGFGVPPGGASPGGQGNLTAIYAASPGEETVDAYLPAGGSKAVAHGLFTYTLCETLARAPRALTYRELAQRIVDRYHASGRTWPTPYAAGQEVDTAALGGAFTAEASFHVAKADGDNYTIDGGAIHGLSKGCILEVHSPTTGAPPLGHLRIAAVSEVESTATPFEFEGVLGSAAKSIPAGAPADLVFVDFGDLRLKVAVVEKTHSGQLLSTDAFDRLEAAVGRELRRHAALITPVPEPSQADWIIEQESLTSDAVCLVRAESIAGGQSTDASLIGPLPRTQLGKLLPEQLSAMARATKLLALARLVEGEQQRGHADLPVDLEMLKFSDEDDRTGSPLAARGATTEMTTGDAVGWRIKNRGAAPIDATLLYVDSHCNIVSIFPRIGSRADNRLTPSQSLVAGRAKITADTTGVEHVVLIATRGEGRPIDFSVLESHTLQLALESSRGPADATFDTALGKLFQSAFYGEGQQRGLTIKEIDQYPLRTISWRVRPGAAAFWGTLENEQLAAAARFQAARELANLPDDDPANAERWQKSAPFVADYLVATLTKNYSQYKAAVAALRPLHKHLIDALAAIFRDPGRSESHHALAAMILADYGGDSLGKLAGLIADADAKSFEPLFRTFNANRAAAVELMSNEFDRSPPVASLDDERPANHLANAAVALYLLGQPAKVWPLLERSPDPRVRSAIIHRIHQFGGEPDLFIEHLDAQTAAAVRQAVVLAIGEFPEDQFAAATRATLVEKVAAMYRLDDDAGFHGAAEWLLRLWHEDTRLEQLDVQLAGRPPTNRLDPLKHAHQWFVNRQLQPLSIVAGPVKFQIGSPTNEPARDGGRESKIERQHEVSIDHSYAIAAHEVTIAEYKRFNAKYETSEQYTSQTSEGKFDERCPVNNLSWYDAAEYCNWLSAQDGIPKDQWCYQPNSAGKFAAGMKPVDGFLKRTGYRLPTEAEWEYACRAGTVTKTYFGQSGELLAKYAWYAANSNKHLQPIAQLKPNDLGLFDMLGNALEWCEDKYGPEMYGIPPDEMVVSDGELRIIRSEKCLSYPENIRSARREIRHTTEKRDGIVGLRPVRTIVEAMANNTR